MVNVNVEQQYLESEIAAIEKWWKSPRFNGVERPYSATEVSELILSTLSCTLEHYSYP